MPTLFPIMEDAAKHLDTVICDVCNLCGDLRMRTGKDGGDDSADDQYQGSDFRLVQQEMRHMRDSYTGLKEAVDRILNDHENRIRALEFRVWLAIGGGGVLGWLGSVAFRAMAGK